MTKKKAVVFLEGNSRAIESAIHELSKLTSEANAQPQLTATLQTEEVHSESLEVEFERQD